MRLLSEGFADWSRKDFKVFCTALETHGRYAITKIIDDVAQETGKDQDDIKKYYVAFWLHYRYDYMVTICCFDLYASLFALNITHQ